MNKYRLVFSPESEKDMLELEDVIYFDYKAPLTAFRYIQGLKDMISILKRSPESYSIQTRKSLLQYGSNVRRINYKKMAIIYTVHGDVVYIHRIVPSAMVTGL